MKAKILFIAAILILSSALVFGASKAGKNLKVTGVVEYYGNAPFARLCIKDSSQDLYYLTGEEKILKSLENMNGFKLCISGTLSEEQAPVEIPSAKVLKVKKWKKLKK